MNCTFCKILNQELPASRIIEDKHNLAFLDIHPVSSGHTLIIPRRHVESFTDLTKEEVTQLFEMGKVVASHLKNVVEDCGGVNLSLADGAVAGQEVPHAHLHVIPRKEGDGFGWKFPPGYSEKAAPREDLERIAALLKNSIERL